MKRHFLLAFLLLALFLPIYAQVGIGTTTPNSHAVLELVSPGNNQGILVPRLTTAQRTAITGLSANDNGLLVFDSDDGKFYFWNNTAWTRADMPQDLSLSGNTLSITGNPNATPIDLAPFAGVNTDNQTLSLNTSGVNRTITITGGNNVTFNVADNDNSTTNEIQNLSFASPNLSISSGNSVNLSALNTDSQDLSLSGTTLSLTGDATSVSLASFLDNTDNQNLSLNTSTNILSLTNDATTVDLSPYKQALTFTSPNLSISGGNSVNLSGLNTDAQNLTFSSPNLSISGGNSVNLSALNTDSQNVTVTTSGVNRTINISGGTGATFSVADNDNNSSNEIQDLSLGTKTGTNQAINISGGGAGVTIDVADNDNSVTNEIQSLTFSSPNLSISGGNSVNLSGLNTDAQSLTFSSPNLSISGGNSVNLSGLNTDSQSLSLGAKSGTGQPINISGGSGVTIDVADNDNSTTNEIQDLSLNAATNVLSLTNDATTVDLSSYKQSLTFTSPNLSISGGNSVDLSGLNTDSQNLSVTTSGVNRTINISGGTGTTFSVADNDNSTTNEIQDLSVVVGGAAATLRTINISGGGTSAQFDVADNDNSITNEIQSLSLSGSTLSLSNGGGSVTLPGGSGVSGSGQSSQVAYWSGTTSLTSSGNFVWDDKVPGLGLGVTPKTTLHNGGSLAVAVTIADSKVALYTVTSKDYAVIIPTGVASVDIPDASDVVGRVLVLKVMSSDDKGVIIRTVGRKDSFDGGGTTLFMKNTTTGDLNSVTLLAAQAGAWVIIGERIRP